MSAQPRESRNLLDLIRDPKTVKAMQSVATKYLTAERLLTVVVNSIAKTPKLAQCTPHSVLGAAMAAQALGLEPNTPLQLCYLIPYERRYKEGNNWKSMLECQFQIGYRGYISLAERSPRFVELQTEAIHEGDTFEHQMGSETFLRYAKSLRDRGPLLGAFLWVKFRSEFGEGQRVMVLPVDEILKVRERSETFRTLRARVESAQNDKERAAAQKKYEDTPWVLWEDQMAVKTVVKRGLQQVSLSPALAFAAQVDTASDEGRLNLSDYTDPEALRAAVNGEAPISETAPGALEHLEANRFEFDPPPATTESQPAARTVAKPKSKSAGASSTPPPADSPPTELMLNAAQIRSVTEACERNGLTVPELCGLLRVESLSALPQARLEEANMAIDSLGLGG